MDGCLMTVMDVRRTVTEVSRPSSLFQVSALEGGRSGRREMEKGMMSRDTRSYVYILVDGGEE